VGELHSRHCTLRFDELENTRQHFDLRVFPNPEILRADPALPRGTAAASVKTRAAPPTARLSKVNEVPVVGETADARIIDTWARTTIAGLRSSPDTTSRQLQRRAKR
jgi:hypothetical protein